MRKKIRWWGAIVLALTLVAAALPADRYFEIAKNLDIFASFYRAVNEAYVDEVNPNTLMRDGIDHMLNQLDPYTNFISEDQVEDFRTQNTGQYGGIGANTRMIGNRRVITMVYEQYPAFKGGLKIGDEVLAIDGKEIANLAPDEASRLMSGQVGTPVKLRVKRLNQTGPIDLEFKRDKIKINNVPYFGLVENDIGYIQLTDFTQEAGKEVKNAVVDLREKGARSFILDLRGNPGGLLFEAVNICNIFLSKGKEVVTTRGKTKDSFIRYETLNAPVDLDVPVIVLINRNSASASEIVAGTLQDYDRAVIMGERSFGKGLVQLSRPLTYKSQVKITTAKYYTPTGRCIQVLDYAHRRDDGSVAVVPDSLKKEFKTSRGRSVYDGGGIDPDVKLTVEEMAPVAAALVREGLLFDYATYYFYSHANIAEPRQFSLSDTEYQDFVNWMKGKRYQYETDTEQELARLKREAQRDRQAEELNPLIADLEKRLRDKRASDLTTFRDQIKDLLEQEIAGRYFLEKGNVAASLKNDDELTRAIELLRQPNEIKKILRWP
ncbi:MAG: S41 family peptidase [Cyclobacteriaceae bacterium]|jgi:carboxyl-terminal processing protease